MSLRSLSLLVLVLLAGTAASVRWYLEADALERPAVERIAPAPGDLHVPLPMRAEPARGQTERESSPSLSGVAHRGQGPARGEIELRVELRPTTIPEGGSPQTLLPLQVGAPR